jgi:hypothetical protein
MSSRVSNFPSDVGAVEAVLSLEFVVALTLISRFKYDKLWMTIDFLAVLIVYRDTSAFLLAMFFHFALVDTGICRRDHRGLAIGPLPRTPASGSCRFFDIRHGTRCRIAVLPNRSAQRVCWRKLCFEICEKRELRRYRSWVRTDIWRRQEGGEGRTDVGSFVCHPPHGLPRLLMEAGLIEGL